MKSKRVKCGWSPALASYYRIHFLFCFAFKSDSKLLLDAISIPRFLAGDLARFLIQGMYQILSVPGNMAFLLWQRVAAAEPWMTTALFIGPFVLPSTLRFIPSLGHFGCFYAAIIFILFFIFYTYWVSSSLMI